jgi:hypothetical protein
LLQFVAVFFGWRLYTTTSTERGESLLQFVTVVFMCNIAELAWEEG